MDNKKTNEIQETWNETRLPKDMVDFSLEYYSTELIEIIDSSCFRIDLENMEESIKRIKNFDRIKNEFYILQQIIDDNEELVKKRFNIRYEDKQNRYTDILPYDSNIVTVGNKQYMNASRINSPFKNAFISTQGPLEATYEDFWKMVWENNSRIIVMLCELEENDRPKCYEYWTNNQIQFSNGLCLKKIDEIKECENLTTRTFDLSTQSYTRKITQLHFRKWPDHGCPEIKETFYSFEKINNVLNNHFFIYKGNSPVIVHCSAGVGRTGTIISIYNINYIINWHINNNLKEIDLNIFNLARKLKEQRRFHIQTKFQYKFIYDYLELSLKKLLKKK